MKINKKIIFIIVSFLSFSLTSSAQYIWRVKSYCPVERDGAAGFSIGAYGYVSCGSNGTFYSKDLWQFDPSHNSWSQKADLPGSQRISPVGFTLNGSGYIGLGWDPSMSQLSDFYKYDPAGNSWTQVASFPYGVYTSSVFVLHDFAYVGLGYNPYNKHVYKYDPVNDSWTQVADLPGSARQSAIAFAIDTLGYMGSGTNGGSSFFSDFYAYHPGTNSWTPAASLPGQGRYGAAAFSFASKGYLGTGGNNAGYLTDFYSYDPVTDSWTSVANFPAAGRRHAATFSIANKGYVCGGITDDSVATSGFYEYGPTDVIGIDELSGDEPYSLNQIDLQHLVLMNSNRKTEGETFSLYSSDGKLICQKTIYSSREILEVKAHASGVYFFRVENKSHQVLKSGKILLQ